VAWSIFDRKSQEAGDWSGFLEQGTKLEGRLESPATLRIESHVKGTIVSEATLILGENSRGDGELVGKSVVIAGHFDGIIRGHTKVELQSKAIVTGDIETPSLLIEPGAIFDGRCHVITAAEPAKQITVPIRSVAHHE
jgi:cytoskeletal protein CcmA (bactofilin family)